MARQNDLHSFPDIQSKNLAKTGHAIRCQSQMILEANLGRLGARAAIWVIEPNA
jgi:hypothetical protein